MPMDIDKRTDPERIELNNRKLVTVISGGGQHWTGAPGFLRKRKSVAEPAAGSGQVIKMPGR